MSTVKQRRKAMSSGALIRSNKDFDRFHLFIIKADSMINKKYMYHKSDHSLKLLSVPDGNNEYIKPLFIHK